LGRSCRVFATEGHFREIEKLDLTTLEVQWRVINEKQAIVSRISEWLDDVDEIVIATDDDREGDAIGWHLVQELRERCPIDGLAISRMVFHEVTEVALKTGFDQRITWTHTPRAQAAVARAIIDRVIGQVMSELISTRMRARGIDPRVGVGRVRAALLHIVADWERTRGATKSDWCVRADATADDDAKVSFWVTEPGAPESPIKRFHERAEAEAVAAALRASGRPHLVIERKAFTLGSAPGVGTAEVLIAAYEQLGLRPIETQRLLQELYEGNRAAVAGAIRAKTSG
jgi:DNA topoisomerase-1